MKQSKKYSVITNRQNTQKTNGNKITPKAAKSNWRSTHRRHGKDKQIYYVKKNEQVCVSNDSKS